MRSIDARGLMCPEPVVLVHKAVKEQPDELTVLVDAVAAKENVTRFASSRGYSVQAQAENGVYTLLLKKK